jgi:hypothetical protein
VEQLLDAGDTAGVGGCGSLGGLAHDGEHRAFDGDAHGGVGGVRSAAQSAADAIDAHDLDAVEGAREAAQHLREDDPAVAACTEERAARDCLEVGADGRRWVRPARLEGGAQGEQHVRAGVAVGDGVDVERVDGVAVAREPRLGGRERAAECRGVYGGDIDGGHAASLGAVDGMAQPMLGSLRW